MNSHHDEVIRVDGASLTVEQVVDVARRGTKVKLADHARGPIQRCRAWVADAVARGEMLYGVTTGFGALAQRAVPPEQAAQLSRNVIISHAVGLGEPLAEEVVRAMLLIRANTLAKGYSGVRIEVIETLLEMLNRRVHPVVPAKGSVGSSGDLAPLSHLALVFSTDAADREEESGEAFYQGRRMSGKEAMRRAGLPRLILEAKEGIALNNGATLSAALLTLALCDAENLVHNSEIALAMTLEAMLGFRDPFLVRLHAARPHPGAMETARRVLRLLEGSDWAQGDEDEAPRDLPPQDRYSLRCAPQVIGAVRDTLAFVRRTVEIELNSATDNPLVFCDLPRAYKVICGGNFHGEPLALAADFLGIAVAAVADIAERRIFALTDPHLNRGLPAMLIESNGLDSGFMLAQYTAAALVSDNKTLAHPDSVGSIPTSANQEDHVSMAANAARHAREIVWNAEQVIAIELLCAAQAVDLRCAGHGLPADRKLGRLGRGTARAHAFIREQTLDGQRPLAKIERDQVLYPYINRLAEVVHSGELVCAVEEAVGA